MLDPLAAHIGRLLALRSVDAEAQLRTARDGHRLVEHHLERDLFAQSVRVRVRAVSGIRGHRLRDRPWALVDAMACEEAVLRMVQHCVQTVVNTDDLVDAVGDLQRVRTPPDAALIVVVDGAHGVGEDQRVSAAAAQIGGELSLGIWRCHIELQLRSADHRDRQRELDRELDLLARPVIVRRQRPRRQPVRRSRTAPR